MNFLDLSAQSSRSSVDISFQRGNQGRGGGDAARVMQPPSQPVKKIRRGPRSKSSQYRGVTFYRRTGRWESHIWDCGKQVYLGGFDTAHAAARVYDRAAVKFRGPDADINFIIGDYEEDIKQMADLSKEEVVKVLRRQSSGFSRNNSRYQGVALQKNWRMGSSNGAVSWEHVIFQLQLLKMWSSQLKLLGKHSLETKERIGLEHLELFVPDNCVLLQLR